MAKKMFAKRIPSKNYYIVLLVSVLVIIFSLYVRSFYLNYRASRINESVFADKTINQINTEDFNFAVGETNEAILYISYTGSNEVYDMERRLYREIKKKHLTEKVIYWNVTGLKRDEYLSILKNTFPDIDDQITSAPMLIYIKDGVAMEAMSSELKLIDYKVLDNLITKYEIE
jgi:hypothetical protein